MKIFSIVMIIVAALGVFCGLSAVVCGIAELGQQGAAELIIKGLIVIFLAGRSCPKIDKLKKIADYFEVPLEYFLEEEAQKWKK